MPITYEVKDEGRLVHATATGVLTIEELLAYQGEFAKDERIVRGVFCEVFDASLAVDSQITEDALRQVAEMLAANPEVMAAQRLAIVVGSHTKIEKIRFYEGLIGGMENLIIFNDLSTALTWLGYRD